MAISFIIWKTWVTFVANTSVLAFGAVLFTFSNRDTVSPFVELSVRCTLLAPFYWTFQAIWLWTDTRSPLGEKSWEGAFHTAAGAVTFWAVGATGLTTLAEGWVEGSFFAGLGSVIFAEDTFHLFVVKIAITFCTSLPLPMHEIPRPAMLSTLSFPAYKAIFTPQTSSSITTLFTLFSASSTKFFRSVIKWPFFACGT